MKRKTESCVVVEKYRKVEILSKDQLHFLKSSDFLTNLIPFVNPFQFLSAAQTCKMWERFFAENANSFIFKDYYINLFKESKDVVLTEKDWLIMLKTRIADNSTRNIHLPHITIKLDYYNCDTHDEFKNTLRFYVERVKCYELNEKIGMNFYEPGFWHDEIGQYTFLGYSPRILVTRYEQNIANDRIDFDITWYAKTKNLYLHVLVKFLSKWIIILTSVVK